MINEISSKTAWLMLREEPKTILIDVRSHAEWMLVGTPVLDSLGKKTVCIEWQDMNGERNPSFMGELESHVQKQNTLLMMCRSGKRSMMAAISAEQEGFNVLNISDGFEGDLNDQHQRKSVNGWCHAGLPWKQV